MAAIAIINRDSGTALDYSRTELDATIRSAFSAAGLDPDVRIVSAKDLAQSLTEAVSEDIDMLIIAGGDGTINSAARCAMAAGKTLGILPMGTLNRLPNDLAIPTDLRAAALVIAQGRKRWIDAGDVNGEVFFCNSFFGLPAIFSEYRNNLRGKPFWERVRGYFRDFRNAARAAREIEVVVDDGAREREMRGRAFAVSNNPYVETEILALHRGWMDKGVLGFYVSRHRSFSGLIWMVVNILLGKWNEETQLERFTAEKITIKSKKSHMKLTNDGELLSIGTPLVYRVRPGALSIMTPDLS